MENSEKLNFFQQTIFGMQFFILYLRGDRIGFLARGNGCFNRFFTIAKVSSSRLSVVLNPVLPEDRD